MKISDIVRKAQGGSDPTSVVRDAVGTTKSAIAEVYVNGSLRRISHESPFLALGISNGQWEAMPPRWRKQVRKLWRHIVASRREVPDLADRLTKELDDFMTQVEAIKPPSNQEEEELLAPARDE